MAVVVKSLVSNLIALFWSMGCRGSQIGQGWGPCRCRQWVVCFSFTMTKIQIVNMRYTYIHDGSVGPHKKIDSHHIVIQKGKAWIFIVHLFLSLFSATAFYHILVRVVGFLTLPYSSQLAIVCPCSCTIVNDQVKLSLWLQIWFSLSILFCHRGIYFLFIMPEIWGIHSLLLLLFSF